MKIKRFNKVWTLMLVLQVIIVTIITLLTKGFDHQAKLRVLQIFNVGECIYLFIYKFGLSKDPNYNFNIWDDLPFYLCNISTITAAVASFLDINYLYGFVSTIGAFGALMAYIYPSNGFDDISLFSIRAIGFYGYHGLIICSGLLFITTGIYQPAYKDIIGIMIYLVIIFTFVHGVNTIIRKTVFPECNYSFTYGPRGNGVLEIVYKKIPINLIYLFTLIPVFAIYCAIVIFIARIFI